MRAPPRVEKPTGTRDLAHRVPLWLTMTLVLAGCGATQWVYGLRPEYPEPRYQAFSSELAFVEVDSLRPVLRWEAFPRAQDRQVDTEGRLSRIRNVTYDLRV